MKYCLKKYPKGTWKGQKSDGKPMDNWLYQNLELLADKISKDMTFLGIIYSSTLEVGTGKSVLATQIGEAWTEIVNKKYNLKIKYDIDNIVWRPKELIEKAFKVPKYSYILLDEWEDSTYWSELGTTLRKFFRKCRQLNLFIMCIIPNWFQLPLSYAISRSVFAIDVKFTNTLDRGNYSFYNFPAKRALYVIGKRNHNYWAARPTFNGKFCDGYGVDEVEYRKRKLEDMEKSEMEAPEKMTKSQIEAQKGYKIFQGFLKKFPKMSTKEIAIVFSVSKNTILRWKRGDVGWETSPQNNYISIPHNIKKEIIMNEEELETFEKNRGDNYNEQEEKPIVCKS